MWGEIKFWVSRYSRWLFVGLGLVVMTLIFILVSRFSASDDRQMKKQVQQVEKTEEVVQEQQEDILGESQFAQAIQDIPTEKELIAFLDSQEYDSSDSYTEEEAYDLIREEYGEGVEYLAENGYIISDAMTADQRTTVQLFQEEVFSIFEDLPEEELVAYTQTEGFVPGIPKTQSNVRKYLGQHMVVNSHIYELRGFEETEMPDEYSLMSLDTNEENVEVIYEVDDELDLGDITLTSGFLAKATNPEVQYLVAYLVFKPNQPMTGEEYVKAIEGVDIKLNNSEPSERIDVQEGVFEDIDMTLLPVHRVDSLHFYGEEEGYDSNEDVTLTVNGKKVNISLQGRELKGEIR